MSLDVVQKHIDLYVNSYSQSLGEKGKSAIENMYKFSVENNLILPSDKSLFV
jgi:1,4-dihydroxy-6-naphthoate synthase